MDVNIDKNIKLKQDNYMLLTSELKRLYPEYDFDIVPIVFGATGLITSNLIKGLKQLGIEDIDKVVLKCQQLSLLGTLKIVKSFMQM